jgi:hypothetical protein
VAAAAGVAAVGRDVWAVQRQLVLGATASALAVGTANRT